VVVLVAAGLPLVLRGSFQQNVMALMAAYAIAALGLNLLVGVAGQISLGHGAFMSIGGYTAAILSVKLGLPPWLGVIGGALFTAVIGFLLGLPALRLRGHFLALATLSFAAAIPQIAVKWDPVTGGASGLAPTKFPSDAVAYWTTLAVLVLLSWVAANLLGSRPGRALHAVRESEVAAQAMGVNLALAKTGIFALSALYAGFAGALATHLSGYISPSVFGLLVSFQLLASVVVGGLGSIGGGILGAAVVAWLPFAASRTQGLASVVEGVAIMAIVLLLPRGLIGVIPRVKGLGSRVSGRPTSVPPVESQPAAVLQLADPRPVTRDPEPLLEVSHLSVSFGGVHALQDVSFTVWSGTIHGLIGPNGAGKTTALNCISRFIDPSQGAIRLDGRDLLAGGPSALAGLGVSRTFQNLALCGTLSALDNVLLGFYHRVKVPALAFALSLPAARRAETEARQHAMRLLVLLDAGHVAASPVRSLPYGQQKRVELARALACEGRLLILDEPAAGLDAGERGALVDLIRRLRDAGQTILLVEHDMGMVMSLCDRVSVLDFGRLIADGSPDEARSNPAVIAAYLGEEASQADTAEVALGA
jgi:ABC-type branched-subunit amino acid transport system ATPase component/ABC-type branched-subunit amino acid transport system permease subunit